MTSARPEPRTLNHGAHDSWLRYHASFVSVTLSKWVHDVMWKLKTRRCPKVEVVVG